MSVSQVIEDAPFTLADTARLYTWSTNYAPGDGPFALFLDMIGYSSEEFGVPLYGPTVRSAENRVTDWDAQLGYVELDYLARALLEYAQRPHDVRAFVDDLMRAESDDD